MEESRAAISTRNAGIRRFEDSRTPLNPNAVGTREIEPLPIDRPIFVHEPVEPTRPSN